MRRAAYIALLVVGCADPPGTNGPDGPAPTVDASGDTGPPPMPMLLVSPPAADFGDVVAGEMGPPTQFTVTNSGVGTSAALTLSITGAGGTAFTIADTTCTGVTLAAGASCVVDIAFLPPSSRRTSTASLVVSDGVVSAMSRLTGRSIPTCDIGLVITPASYDFGTMAVGGSVEETFTLTNECAPLGTMHTALGGVDVGEFALRMDGCDGQTLAPGSACSLSVVFGPTTPGTHTASLDVTTSSAGTFRSALVGVGVVR